MSDQEIPIVCNLHALLDPEAHQRNTVELMSQAVSYLILSNGCQIDFPISALRLATEFVDGERKCCPFLFFKLFVAPGSQTLCVQIVGLHRVEAVRELLKAELTPLLPDLLVQGHDN